MLGYRLFMIRQRKRKCYETHTDTKGKIMTWDNKYIKDQCSYYMGYEAGLIAAKREYIEVLHKYMARNFDDFMDQQIKMYNNMAKSCIDMEKET